MQDMTKIIVVTCYLLENNIIQEPLKHFSSPCIIRHELQVKVFDLDFVWKISIWAIFALYYATTWPKLKLIKFKLSKKAAKKYAISRLIFKFTK